MTDQEKEALEKEHGKLKVYEIPFRGEVYTFAFKQPSKRTVNFANKQMIVNRKIKNYNETIIKNSIVYGLDIYNDPTKKAVYNAINQKVPEIITSKELSLVDYSEVPTVEKEVYEAKNEGENLTFFTLQDKELEGIEETEPVYICFKVPSSDLVEKATAKIVEKKDFEGYQNDLIKGSFLSNKKMLSDLEVYFAVSNVLETVLNGGIEVIKKN